MADYVELSAPTPWLILATEDDYFTPAGRRLVYDEARHWYGLTARRTSCAFLSDRALMALRWKLEKPSMNG